MRIAWRNKLAFKSWITREFRFQQFRFRNRDERAENGNSRFGFAPEKRASSACDVDPVKFLCRDLGNNSPPQNFCRAVRQIKEALSLLCNVWFPSKEFTFAGSSLEKCQIRYFCLLKVALPFSLPKTNFFWCKPELARFQAQGMKTPERNNTKFERAVFKLRHERTG